MWAHFKKNVVNRLVIYNSQNETPRFTYHRIFMHFLQ